MKKQILKLGAIALIAIFPVFASAASPGQIISAQIKAQVCEKLKTKPSHIRLSLPLPPFCDKVVPPPPPPPPPATTTVSLLANPTTIVSGATSTLSWTSTNATSCTASDGWSGVKATTSSEIVSPVATTTYILVCSGATNSATSSATVNVTPAPPVPTLDHLIITEVYYDTASTTAESDGPNEWIEIYNGTGATVDLTGWSVWDSATSSSDILGTTTLPHGGFLIITASSTTAGFWSIPATTTVIVLPNSIGSNGLSNNGDAVFLKNNSGVVIDSMSYATNTDVFDPAAVDVVDGHSLKRSSLSVDTNTAADWVDSTSPNPGNF